MDIKIPSEGYVFIKDKVRNRHPVRIAVIRLRHISNFTEFEPLEKYADIEYIEAGEDPGEPDAIILPGTKNTIDDLKELRMKGMDVKIITEAKKGTPVIGICGGYQMLGTEIVDSGIEGTGGEVSLRGLGLLDVSTRFCEYKKRTEQVEKIITGDGEILGLIKGERGRGNEIHMGETRRNGHAFGVDGRVITSGRLVGS